MKKPNLKQFKLSTSEELICEVIEWDVEKSHQVLIRGAMALTKGEDIDRGIRFWSLRPWLGLTDQIDSLQTINASHIIGEQNPSQSLITHYVNTVQKVLKNEEENKLVDVKLDDIVDMNFEMSDEYLEEFDYDSSNTQTFLSKGTVH